MKISDYLQNLMENRKDYLRSMNHLVDKSKVKDHVNNLGINTIKTIS